MRTCLSAPAASALLRAAFAFISPFLIATQVCLLCTSSSPFTPLPAPPPPPLPVSGRTSWTSSFSAWKPFFPAHQPSQWGLSVMRSWMLPLTAARAPAAARHPPGARTLVPTFLPRCDSAQRTAAGLRVKFHGCRYTTVNTARVSRS